MIPSIIKTGAGLYFGITLFVCVVGTGILLLSLGIGRLVLLVKWAKKKWKKKKIH